MKPFSKRRGRPRKNRPNLDLGTPELQKKRKSLSPQPDLCESLLGVLWAHELITKDMFEAGRALQEAHYAYQFCLADIHPKTTTHEIIWSTPTQPRECRHCTPLPSAKNSKAEKRWNAIHRFLKNLDPPRYNAVMTVTLQASPYESLPYNKLAHAKIALIKLDSWLRGQNRARIKKKT